MGRKSWVYVVEIVGLWGGNRVDMGRKSCGHGEELESQRGEGAGDWWEYLRELASN